MLRIQIIQETAHFKIPTIGNPYLTYFLPPPSTIYGFLRRITNYESINYTNTLLSIQGRYNAISLEKEKLILETQKETKTNIIAIQKLHNVRWIIHVKSHDYENKILESFNCFKGILRLGRVEDLVIDYAIERVDEKDFNNEELEEDYFIYIKWKKGEAFKGQLFSMFIDSKVDKNKKIIGYEPIQLIYSSVWNAKNKIKIWDGKYLISWIF